MAFFDRFRKTANENRNGVRPAQPTGWENMEPPVSQEDSEKRANVERQKRKILAAFALGVNGHVNYDALNQQDIALDPAARDDIIDKMASGRYGIKQEHDILTKIWGPMQTIDNAGNVIDTINTKHEKRILAQFGIAGFDNWQNVNASDLSCFVKNYPTPLDFQEKGDKFLESIELGSGKEKRQEYEVAMSSFMHKVYGKKQEYWESIRELEDEAEEARKRHEIERSGEWVPGEVGVWQTSRDQSNADRVNREDIDRGLWADVNCEDTFFSRPDKQLYGVFDGAGGIAGGRLASQMVANTLREFSDQYDMNSCSAYASAMEEAHKRVIAEPKAGMTTAAIAGVVNRNGRIMLAYASIGDSRIYIVDKAGKTRLITKDEGLGKFVENVVGQVRPDGGPITQQFGEIDIHPGDRVVICSDGITGDYGLELMSEKELGGIVRNSHGPVDAAKNLLTAARKKDDRTAVVFTPDFEKAKAQ